MAQAISLLKGKENMYMDVGCEHKQELDGKQFSASGDLLVAGYDICTAHLPPEEAD